MTGTGTLASRRTWTSTPTIHPPLGRRATDRPVECASRVTFETTDPPRPSIPISHVRFRLDLQEGNAGGSGRPSATGIAGLEELRISESRADTIRTHSRRQRWTGRTASASTQPPVPSPCGPSRLRLRRMTGTGTLAARRTWTNTPIIRPPTGRGATDRPVDRDSGVQFRTPAPLPHRSYALPLILIRGKWGLLRLSVPRRVWPRYPDHAIGTDTDCSASTDLPPGHGCPVGG